MEQAGFSTIKFKDGSSLTVPFSSIRVMPAYVHVFIDGNKYTFNRRILDVLPEELDKGNSYHAGA